jgi:hypothetical protein
MLCLTGCLTGCPQVRHSRHSSPSTQSLVARQRVAQPASLKLGRRPPSQQHVRHVAGGTEGHTARQPQAGAEAPFSASTSAVLLGGTACASNPSAWPLPAPCSAWPCAACSSCSSCSKCAACPNCGTVAAQVCLKRMHNSIQVHSTTAVEQKGLCRLPNRKCMCEWGCALSACRRRDSTSPRTRTCVPAHRPPFALPSSNNHRATRVSRQSAISVAGKAHHISPASPSPHSDCQRSGLCRVRPPYVTASVWCPAVGKAATSGPMCARPSLSTTQPSQPGARQMPVCGTRLTPCPGSAGHEVRAALRPARPCQGAAGSWHPPARRRVQRGTSSPWRAGRPQVMRVTRRHGLRVRHCAKARYQFAQQAPSVPISTELHTTQEPAMPCLDRQSYPQACLMWVDRALAEWQGGG